MCSCFNETDVSCPLGQLPNNVVDAHFLLVDPCVAATVVGNLGQLS